MAKDDLKPTDKIGIYDPFMAAIDPTGRHRNVAGGYKIWPEDKELAAAADLRIMSIGNSTSLWPSAAWSIELAEMLADQPAVGSRRIAVYNGAGKGNTSSQEVLRVLRDTPGIAPHLIISLSGICDIGYLLNARNQPFSHKYTRRVMDHVRETDLVDNVIYGYPNEASGAASWLRNQRMARVMADEMGIPIVVFLQAVQGYGRYDQTPEEIAFLAEKSPVILKAANKSYIQCVTEFYDEVRATIAADPVAYDHVVDFTDVFADCPGAFRDHRHQSPLGVTHVARKMMPVITRKIETLTLS
jgi:hypothetical protein